MYDYLLDTDLGGKSPGYSSASLVALVDDNRVIATGRNKNWLEEVANGALSAVAGWMKRNGLTLSVHKTEAVMLTRKRGYETHMLMVEGVKIQPKDSLK